MNGHDTGGREEALADDRRRYLLYCLYLYTPPMKLADVAEQVLVWKTEEEPEDYLRERLYLYNDLYHEHLPVLREADLVEYDQREDEVDLGPAAAEFEPTLERHLSTELGDLLHAEHGAFEDTPLGPFPEGLYDALADPDRRQMLYYLLDRDRASLEELADVLAGGRAADEGAVDPEVRERLRTALERDHVPLLEEVGLVAHDAEGDAVRLLPLAESVREVVRSAVPAGSGRSRPSATVRGGDRNR